MSDSEDSEFDDAKQENLIRNFDLEGQMILSNLLPKKSRERYEIVYDDFTKWSKKNNINCTNENVLLVYFDEQSKNVKPSTIWSRWSMLRLTLLHRQNIDISKYQHLKSFLKNFSKGYKPKQAKSLTGSEIAKFLNTADNFYYLGTKTILIFGICGAARCCELVNLKITDVEDLGNYFNVHIRDSKNDYPRTFVICAPYYQTVKEYLLLRPNDLDSNRFFIGYTKGKCVRQVVGKHKISEVPKTIASYLNLQYPDLYTGHSLRRTSATLLSDSGASLVKIKNLGAWKLDAVAQRYIDDSDVSKKQNFDGISSRIYSSSSRNTLTSIKSSTVTSKSIIQNDSLNESTRCLKKSVDNNVCFGASSEPLLQVNSGALNEPPLQVNSGALTESSLQVTSGASNEPSTQVNLVHCGSSSETPSRVDKLVCPEPSKESLSKKNLIKETLKSAHQNSKKSSAEFETVEDAHSPSSSKKTKLNREYDAYEKPYGPLNFYNCENITINFNNYSCSHVN